MQRLQNLPKWIDGIWLILLSIYVIAGTSSVPFHGDESTVIYMGRDYHYHFIEGDMSKIFYDETGGFSATEQYLRLINGTIPKYIYGWISFNYGYTPDTLNEQWDWGADYYYNQSTNRIPEPVLLQTSRIASSIQLAVATTILFIITKIIFNRPTAYLASLYFVLNPLILLNGRRAMMEGSHLLGMMILLFAALWVIRQNKWWQYTLMGIVAGFAVASKHPNAIVNALLFIACLTYAGKLAFSANPYNWRIMKQTIVGLGIAGTLTIGIFYVLNPALWQSPIEGIQTSLELRRDLLNIQSESFNSYTSLQTQLNGFFDYVFIGQPQYYEDPDWVDYPEITSQIQNYDTSFLSGVAIGGSTIGGLIMLLIVGFGVIHFAQNKNILLAYRWLILVWGIGICVITFILTPLAWARYYLPIIPFVGMMLAYGVFTLISLLQKDS